MKFYLTVTDYEALNTGDVELYSSNSSYTSFTWRMDFGMLYIK